MSTYYSLITGELTEFPDNAPPLKDGWILCAEPAISKDPEMSDAKNSSAFDTQVGGSHYKNMAIQPTEYIVKNGLNFVEGNIIKYVTRYKFKGGLEDLKKAQHYLAILIELEESNGIGT